MAAFGCPPRRDPSELGSLADVVERSTANLPALIRDFVDHIHARGLLRYRARLGWTWDPAEIAATDIPDSTVELMSGKLDRLAPSSRALLDLASCIGDEFDVHLLCELSGRELMEVSEALGQVAQAGLLIPCPNGLRFAHDRIRECAQQQLSVADRSRIHCATARLLLERISDLEGSPRALEIVEHLNHVPDLPADLTAPAIRLNYAVGNRALSVGAAAAADHHFALARGLVARGASEIAPAFALDLHLQSAESAYQLGEFERALELIDEIDCRNPSILELARIESKRIQVLAISRDADVCVRHTLAVLGRLGRRWPLHPSKFHAQVAIWRIQLKLRAQDVDRLQPATSAEPSEIAPLLVIRSAAAALARVNVNLAVLATCLSMRQHLQNGFWTPPGFPIAVYALYLYLFLGSRTQARRLAETALAWTDRLPDPTAPRARMMVEVLLYPFLMGRRQALAQVDRIVEGALESGDPEFAAYARLNHTCYLALAGDPVREIAERLHRMADVRGSQLWLIEIERCRAPYAHLDGEHASPDTLEQSFASQLQHDGVASTGQGVSGTIWLMVLCTFGRFDLALAHSELLAPMLFRISPFVHVVDHTFYRGLAAAVLASSSRGRERRRCRKVMRQSLRYVRRCARDGPDFKHMEGLLEAERARLGRHTVRARSLYEKSANAAVRQGFPHHAALAHERHASLVASLRRHTEAATLLRKAIASYREWGALAKVRALSREHRELNP